MHAMKAIVNSFDSSHPIILAFETKAKKWGNEFPYRLQRSKKPPVDFQLTKKTHDKRPGGKIVREWKIAVCQSKNMVGVERNRSGLSFLHLFLSHPGQMFSCYQFCKDNALLPWVKRAIFVVVMFTIKEEAWGLKKYIKEGQQISIPK